MHFFSQQIHCPHFKKCFGCCLDEAVDNPPILEEAKKFFRERGIDPFVLHTGKPTEWRYRAKLAVRGTRELPQIGLFKEGSHEIVDIPSCKVHHPQINQAVEYLKKFIQQEKIPPYREKDQKGLLRYVQLVVQRKTGKVQLSLVLNVKSITENLQNSIIRFWKETGGDEFWHSLWINYNKRKDNVILGKEWLFIQGEQWLWERFGDKEVCFHPASFAQANVDLFEKMLQKIEGWIPRGTTLAEYYSGVGVIGLCLADSCQEVRCCEVSPHAIDCFNLSKKKLPYDIANRLKFYEGPVSENLDLLIEANTILVDPPRKGLDPLLLKALEKAHEGIKLIYVSCGWEAFQSDCNFLLEAGWKLETAEGYLFFPGSNFIETLAILKK